MVVGAVVLAKVPLRRRDLSYFLGKDEAEESIGCILNRLSSVIQTETSDKIIHISHLSFTEFICDPLRCEERFVIHRDVHNQIMAIACLQIMQTGLRFNICDLETSYVRNIDISDLASRIEKSIPTRLSYSCRFFAGHLQTTTIDVQLVKMVESFLLAHLLHWMEVMSLIKEVNTASLILMSIRDLIEVSSLGTLYY